MTIIIFILEKLNIKKEIGRDLKGKYNSCLDFYNDETREIVNNIYRKDLEIFGYEFNDLKKREFVKMRKNVKVSVIIPMYNKGKFIERCLNSVFNQTFKDYEIIVIDDASKDKSVEIVKKYSNVKLLSQEQNKGPGPTRNKGAKQSIGEYIVFLDADDEWLPNFLEETVKMLDENNDCSCVVTSHYVDDQNGNKRDMTEVFQSRGVFEGKWKLPLNTDPKKFKPIMNFFATTGCVLVKRKVFEDLEGFYDIQRYDGEDMHLWYKIVFKYQIYRTLKPLIHYHTNDSDLRLGAAKNVRIFSAVMDPSNLKKTCIQEYQELLERCLAYNALTTIEKYLSINNIEKAKHVISLHNKIRLFELEFTKINQKILNT